MIKEETIANNNQAELKALKGEYLMVRRELGRVKSKT